MISQKDFIVHASGKKERIQRMYIRLSRLLNRFFPVKFPSAGGNKCDYLYLTICRHEDFDMVIASVYTLYKNSQLCPNKVVVVSDGSWDLNTGLEYFRKFNIDIDVCDWRTCADYYKESFQALRKWAYRQIWGKKMAAILYYSEHNKVLFSDPDVLWYNSPMSEAELKKSKLKLSIDNSHNYDDEFIRTFSLAKLYDREEPINCGVVFISGGISLLPKEAYDCIEYESEHCGRFAEQTVFAIMDLYYDNRWTMQQISSEIGDLLQPFNSKTIFYNGMIARHYLWRLKWIYWKDFFIQRRQK